MANFTKKETAACCHTWKNNFTQAFVIAMAGLRNVHPAQPGKPSFNGISLSALTAILTTLGLIAKDGNKVLVEPDESHVVGCLVDYVNGECGYDIIAELTKDYLLQKSMAC